MKYLINININNNSIFINLFFIIALGIGDWGLGIGDWGLGVGGLGPGPQPQNPNPQPHPQR